MIENSEILVVEDDMNSARLIKDLLIVNKAKVILVKDGKNAILQFKNKSFDVVVLDLRLPEENGFVVAEKIQQQIYNKPHIIVTSAFSDKQNKISAYKSGTDAFLSKPIDHNELITLIDSFSEKKQKNDKKIIKGLKNFNSIFEKQLNRINHGKKVAAICNIIAETLNIEDNYLQILNDSAELHDIGLSNCNIENNHEKTGAQLVKNFGVKKEIEILIKNHHSTSEKLITDKKLLEIINILQIAEKIEEVYKKDYSKLNEDLKDEIIKPQFADITKKIINT